MGVSVHQHDCRDNQSFIFIPSVTGADQYFAVTSVCNFTAVEASSDASLCGNPGCGRAMELVRIWDARRGVVYERALPARVTGSTQAGDLREEVRGERNGALALWKIWSGNRVFLGLDGFCGSANLRPD